MKNIKEITSRPWDYTLYKENSEYVLTVIFFAQIDYPRSFRINTVEANQNLEVLSERIRNNYCEFKDREVKPPFTRSLLRTRN